MDVVNACEESNCEWSEDYKYWIDANTHANKRAYNQLEVYKYNTASSTWEGPSVYFSPTREIGVDSTSVFDSFWADDMTFEGDTCFNNYCEMDKQLCNGDEVCKQSWDSDLGKTKLQCCDQDNSCRAMSLPSKTFQFQLLGQQIKGKLS